MSYYKIADLIIEINGISYDYFKKRLKAYELCSAADKTILPDVIFNYSEKEKIEIPIGEYTAEEGGRFWLKTADGGFAFYDELKRENKNITRFTTNDDWSKCDYETVDLYPLFNIAKDVASFNLIGSLFKYIILLNQGIVLHSSTINYNENGIAFFATSGTGKSTHTALWKQYYGEKTKIINDDAPVMRFIDNIPFVFGAPWSGKTEINLNEKVPLKAIVFLKQSKTNSIRKVDVIESLTNIMKEISKPVYSYLMDKLMETLNRLLCEVPMYELSCDISKNAVDLVKTTLEL